MERWRSHVLRVAQGRLAIVPSSGYLPRLASMNARSNELIRVW